MYIRSACDTAFATLLKSLAGVSVMFPFSSLNRYLAASILIAFVVSFSSSLTPRNVLNSLISLCCCL